MSLRRHEACRVLPKHDLAETDRWDRVVAGLWSSVRESADFTSEGTGAHGWGWRWEVVQSQDSVGGWGATVAVGSGGAAGTTLTL